MKSLFIFLQDSFLKCFVIVFLSILALFIQKPLLAQEINVSGTVTAMSDGHPLSEATIRVKGTTMGTTTNDAGYYKIAVPSGNDVLIFSSVGYQDKEIIVNERTSINVKLEVLNKGLNEVVVVGYGTQKKKDLTGSISTITSEDIAQRPVHSFEDALSGVAPGINVAPNTPTKDLINAYEVDDKRKDASIAFTTDGRPYIIKFKDPNVSTGNDADIDFPVLRYADVLLMLAEAMGESPQAYHYINLVRNRAGLSDIDKNTPGTFMEKLMHERQVELAFECQRWHDILRMGETQAVSLMNAHLANEYPTQNFHIDKHDLLNPMPISEMQSNAKMEDNPGY